MNKRIPNFTQVPNFFFDEVLHNKDISCVDFTILMVIARKTYGWHKDSDKISLSQFEKSTGMARTTISRSIKKLVDQKLLVKEAGNNKGKISQYEILITEDTEPSSAELPARQIPSSAELPIPSSGKLHTKETIKIKKSQNKDEFLIKFWNKTHNTKITLTEPRKRRINKVLKDKVSIKRLCYCFINIKSHKWSIENRQVRFDRFFEQDKSDRNYDEFSNIPFKKNVQQKAIKILDKDLVNSRMLEAQANEQQFFASLA